MLRYVARSLIFSGLLLGPCGAAARGDGGVVRVVEQQSGYQISVFTSPNPLCAGPVDVSVLVQYAETGQPVPETDVSVIVTPRNRSGSAIHAAATEEAATNKLLRAAVVELPDAGWWDVDVVCIAKRSRAHVHFAMESGPPLPHWLTVWPWFTWPAGAVLLFALHRLLVWRKRAPAAPNARRTARKPQAIAPPFEHQAQHS